MKMAWKKKGKLILCVENIDTVNENLEQESREAKNLQIAEGVPRSPPPKSLPVKISLPPPTALFPPYRSTPYWPKKSTESFGGSSGSSSITCQQQPQQQNEEPPPGPSTSADARQPPEEIQVTREQIEKFQAASRDQIAKFRASTRPRIIAPRPPTPYPNPLQAPTGYPGHRTRSPIAYTGVYLSPVVYPGSYDGPSTSRGGPVRGRGYYEIPPHYYLGPPSATVSPQLVPRIPCRLDPRIFRGLSPPWLYYKNSPPVNQGPYGNLHVLPAVVPEFPVLQEPANEFKYENDYPSSQPLPCCACFSAAQRPAPAQRPVVSLNAKTRDIWRPWHQMGRNQFYNGPARQARASSSCESDILECATLNIHPDSFLGHLLVAEPNYIKRFLFEHCYIEGQGPPHDGALKILIGCGELAKISETPTESDFYYQ